MAVRTVPVFMKLSKFIHSLLASRLLAGVPGCYSQLDLYLAGIANSENINSEEGA